MIAKILAILISKKTIVLAFLGLIPATFFIVFVNLPVLSFEPKFSYRFGIPTSFSFNGETWDCIKDKNNIAANIVNPLNNSTFLNTESINLKRELNIDCEELNESWILNDSVISTDSTYTLKNLSVGTYNLRYKLILTDNLVIEDSVKFSIKEQPKTPTPSPKPMPVPNPVPNPVPVPPPPPPVYTAPSVSIITPKNGEVIGSYYYNTRAGSYYGAYVDLVGSVKDAYDVPVSDKNISWFYQEEGGTKTFIGNGTSISRYMLTSGDNCISNFTIYLRATNSYGKTTEKSIVITLDCEAIILY